MVPSSVIFEVALYNMSYGKYTVLFLFNSFIDTSLSLGLFPLFETLLISEENGQICN